MASLALPGLTGTVTYVGDPISSDLFGANFLFDRDGGTSVGTISDSFKAFAEEVDLGTLRYPGGTVTEVALDLSDPNSTTANYSGVNNTRTEATVGVSDFLDYAASLDATATFVLPTYRFLSDDLDATGNRMLDTAQESNLRSYVDFVLTDANSRGVTVAGFEIGNEWYVDNSKVFGFQMSPIEYGRVAAYLSVVVEQEIDRLNASLDPASQIDPDIVVQVGPGGNAELFMPDGQIPASDYSGPLVSATELIFDQFTSMESRAAVDGILSHRYLTGSDSSVNGWAYQPSKTWATLAAATPGFSQPKIYVTEWNVAARNSDEHGLKQVDSMVELVKEMAVAGVDHADVWAVEQNNKTRMIQNTGVGAEVYGGLSLGGVVFDMMATQLKGTRVISAASAISGVEVNAFGSAAKSIYFLSNRSEADRADSITLKASTGGAHHVTIYEITSEEDGTPIVTIRTINLTSTVQQIPLEFSANETMMIVVAKGTSGTAIEGYDQFDQLTGSAYSDTILGGGGDDTLAGLAGNDRLSGETGNDSISGGDGNDTLAGDSGSDQLDGGAGNDILAGGGGDDTLIGGVGLDVASYASATQGLVLGLGSATLTVDGFGTDSLSGIEGLEGGSGNDRLMGDAGANILMGGLGNDTLVGGVGNDTLIGGAGIDTADYSGATGAVSVNLGLVPAQATLGAGTDTLQNIENVIGTAFTDTMTGDIGANRLEGGAGRDILAGAGGADSLFGGDGDDLFVISSFGDHVSGEQIVGGSGQDELRFTGTVAGTLVLDHDVDVERVVIGTGTAAAAVTTGSAAINVDASAVDHGISILGNAGANRLTGGAGADQLDGGAGNDILAGGGGDDTLIGGVGVDNLSGGLGHDMLVGGAGNDILTGGGGGDEFVISTAGDGVDRITDFDLVDDGLGYSDILVFDGVGIGEFQYLGASSFTGGLDNSEAIFSGGKVLVDINGDGAADITLILDGLVAPDQLNSGEFIFKP